MEPWVGLGVIAENLVNTLVRSPTAQPISPRSCPYTIKINGVG
jgi:hypothetical protein